MSSRSGWLQVHDSEAKEGKSQWCVLDNGVLWMCRRPGEKEGREALPLHDAVVGASDPPAPLQFAVKCRRSGRLVALTSPSREDHGLWLSAISNSAREWREKRRASVLNKQIIALGEDEILPPKTTIVQTENHRFTIRRCSEIPRPSTELREVEAVSPGSSVRSRPSLKELVQASNEQPRWSNLPEVLESGLLGLLTEEQRQLEELKFSALAAEARFGLELHHLLRLATRAVSWRDTLPAFHRRSIVASISKVKKCSDHVVREAEKHWSHRVTLQTTVFSLLGTEARNAGWCEAYTEYCSHLPELRALLRRAMCDRSEVMAASHSTHYGLELALVPVQHLTSLRQVLQTIFEMLSPSSIEISLAKSTRDFLNEILDSCYTELTDQSGSEYVAQMDNALSFDLSALTGAKGIGTRRPIPTQKKENDITTKEESKEMTTRVSKSRSRPSIFSGAFKTATHFLRRRTAEGANLKDARRASMPAVMFSSTPKQDESGNESSDEGKERKACAGEVPVSIPRFFCDEPFYQHYYATKTEELVERALQKGQQDHDNYLKKVPTNSTPGERCSQWSDNSRVIEDDILGQLSANQRLLAEVKFELMCSEASYLRSMRVLEAHFAHCPEMYDEEILPQEHRHVFFSGIDALRSSSEHLLAEMERCWEKDVLMADLCNAMHRHASSAGARVAALACVNQRLVGPALQALREQRPQFAEVLSKLEGSLICARLPLLSFLTLPSRRLSRVLMLLEDISGLMDKIPGHKVSERAVCEGAVEAVTRLLTRAEDASKRAYSDEQLQVLSTRLSFRRVPRLALSAEGRAMVHRGSWQVLGRREDGRGAFKAVTKNTLIAFLLTDLLLLVQPDGEGSYHAVDYCARTEMTLSTAGPGAEEPLPGYLEGTRHALLLRMRGYAGKTVEMVLSCEGGSDHMRWLGAATGCEVVSSTPPQRSAGLVRVLRPHLPLQPDELAATPGDVLAVVRNPGDGWILGRSLLHKDSGWFPADLCVHICSGRKSVTFLVGEGRERFSIA